MRIALYSDLHNELGQPFEPPADLDADLVILAGDIGTKAKGVKWARQTFGQAFGPDRTLYVPGNHEYYGASLGLLDELRRTGSKAGVTVLNNEVAVVEEVRVLGTTLWSDFSLYGPERVSEVRLRAREVINDFSLIQGRRRQAADPLEAGESRLEPQDVAELHRTARRFLEQELAKPWPGKTVVVTHFAPHRSCIAPQFAGNALTAYFVSDMADLMETYRIDLWVFGHTHTNVDFVAEGGCRVVSNQRGYPHESAVGFRPGLVLEV